MKKIHIFERFQGLDITALVSVKVGKDGSLRVFDMRGEDITGLIIFGVED